ncbi:MAG TPA: alpha/beta fold hydrolase [Candidatus Acidoferrales bacterium]|nr:alpha/beta fold hydrolase [Candidatus Acidoferrales bacterium]
MHSAATQGLEGRWSGTLQAGEAVLHIVLHLSKNADGTYKGVLDSLDQAVYGIEASDVAVKGAALSFQIPSVNAAYEGKISPDRRQIEGLWTQGKVGLELVLRRESAVEAKAAIYSAEGTWQGALETTGLRLRLQLHVSHDGAKHLVAALDSLDQAAPGLPATKVSQEGSTLRFEIPAVDGSYEGTLDASKENLQGTWTQSGVAQKLGFHRSDEPLELRRPQNPAKPYPYKQEEVSFAGGGRDVRLAGTLTLPAGAGKFPAVVLLSGSGPHDRDESLAGHQPFLVLADALTKAGIAVLRYDKRGVAKSTGDYGTATSEDFASDAEAAIAYLKSRGEIDAGKIGLIGHSEGGLLAPLVSTRSNGVAFIVLLAGPALKGEDTLLLQSRLLATAAGMSDEHVEASLAFNRQAYALVRQERDPAALEKKVNELVEASGLSGAMPPAAIQQQIRMMSSPWFRTFLDYDPVPALEKTKCPVLALDGEKDLQVPPKENLPLIEKALKAGGNPDFTVKEMPGLNHLFQDSPTGSPTEYGEIEETMSPTVLSLVSEWIQKHTGPEKTVTGSN